MGHQDQGRKNYRSTKTTKTETSDSQHDDFTAYPTIDDGTKTNSIYASVIDIPASTGQVYTDQTGRFPNTSSRGNKYVTILYDYNSNAILAEPLKSKSEGQMIRAYTKLHEYLSDRGLKLRLKKLDNECPAGLKRFMTQHEVDFQLVPLHIHRRNSAKRAISSWKDHFIAGLSSLHPNDPNFPMHLWW